MLSLQTDDADVLQLPVSGSAELVVVRYLASKLECSTGLHKNPRVRMCVQF